MSAGRLHEAARGADQEAAARFATNLAMAVDRLPEHADKFKRELNVGMKAALGSGTAILVPALEAASG